MLRRGQQQPLDGAPEGRGRVGQAVVAHRTDLLQRVRRQLARSGHVRQHLQDVRAQVLKLGTKELHRRLRAQHRILDRHDGVHRGRKGVPGVVAAHGKLRRHGVRIQADGGKGLLGRLGAVDAADAKLLDRVADLVNAKCTALGAADQRGHHLVGG